MAEMRKKFESELIGIRIYRLMDRWKAKGFEDKLAKIENKFEEERKRSDDLLLFCMMFRNNFFYAEIIQAQMMCLIQISNTSKFRPHLTLRALRRRWRKQKKEDHNFSSVSEGNWKEMMKKEMERRIECVGVN